MHLLSSEGAGAFPLAKIVLDTRRRCAFGVILTFNEYLVIS
jgi:hypothetical protein